jgi:hypothetical protein
VLVSIITQAFAIAIAIASAIASAIFITYYFDHTGNDCFTHVKSLHSPEQSNVRRCGKTYYIVISTVQRNQTGYL